MTLPAHRKIPEFIFFKKPTCSKKTNVILSLQKRVHHITLFLSKKYEEGREYPECENALLLEQHL